ncbi:hypothetical protein INT47_005559 [Mucor saturninus]|uniref:Retrotransposon gag domain-containing protein n=1 Tax=Mucor saturninus TaxID=64648 RepID=A0A8H7RE22_9FUNG|nr:hypothetical protein INT47_005559 [Mucor saturninus]
MNPPTKSNAAITIGDEQRGARNLKSYGSDGNSTARPAQPSTHANPEQYDSTHQYQNSFALALLWPISLKILLATSCLTGPAHGYIEPFLSKLDAPSHDKLDVLTSHQVFVDTITAAFCDCDPTVSADFALRRLRQTNSATAYATEFRRLASLVLWNDAALVSQHKVNLRDVIQDELARRPSITNLESLMTASIDIDNRLFQRQRTRRLIQGPMGPTTQAVTNTTAPIDIDRLAAIASSSKRQVRQDERVRRNQEKARYYCRVSGRYSNQCPTERPSPGRQTISKIRVRDSVIRNAILIDALYTQPRSEVAPSCPTIVRDYLHFFHVRYDHYQAQTLHFSVSIGNTNHQEHCMVMDHIDTGTAVSIISKELVYHLDMLITPTNNSSHHLRTADGFLGRSTGSCITQMYLGNTIDHKEEIKLRTLDELNCPLILVIYWLRKRHVLLDFSTDTTLLHCYTTIYCAPTESTFVMTNPSTHVYHPSKVDDKYIVDNKNSCRYA